MALINDQNKVPVLALVLTGLIGYMLYTGTGIDAIGMDGIQAREAHVIARQDTLNAVLAQTDSAKRELAKGTAEDLRKELDSHRASLALLRQMVPEMNEVPNLLDAISTRAKIRGVNLAQVVPLPEQAGPAPFNTYTYNISVLGHYDEIGEFLADIASLPRIIVPQAVSMAPAAMSSAKVLGDTSGALLEAKFQIRTFVKSAEPEGANSGT
jgi:type IV pilus assembly protein PilO